MTNLIENAVNYTPDGGAVSVQTWSEDSKIVVEVRDTGIGIGDEDLPHIFEHFYRSDRARSTNTGGTGLGLAMVRRIVEIHRGRIEVESAAGKGSTFRVYLPAASMST
jgi:two-component system phosphate regulon sensor histidine kinase PhoR